MVRPELLRGVPSSERANAALITKRLEAISLGFRFLDLPAELRSKVYGFYLAKHSLVVIRPDHKKTAGYPAITKVSQQIRSEVLPLFYASTIFELFYCHQYPNMMRLAQFLASTIGDGFKHLRCILVRITIDQIECPQTRSLSRWPSQKIRFSIDGDGDMQVQYPEELTQDSKALLEKHAKLVRDMSSATGKDGRALLLALVTLQSVNAPESLQVKF